MLKASVSLRRRMAPKDVFVHHSAIQGAGSSHSPKANR